MQGRGFSARQDAGFGERGQLFLAGQQPIAQHEEIELRFAAQCEQAVWGVFLLLDLAAHHLGQAGDSRVGILGISFQRFHQGPRFTNQRPGTIERALGDMAAQGGVENLFLDQDMDMRFNTNPPDETAAATGIARTCEGGEQIFESAMIAPQQRNRIRENRIAQEHSPGRSNG